MRVVRLECDHAAQQALHVGHAVKFFSHHGLLVDQVGVVGEALAGGSQHIGGVLPALDVAQHLGLGHQLGAGVVAGALGHGLDQGAGLFDLALARQDGGAPHLHLQRTLRAVHLGQPGFGGGHVTTLLGGLRKQQPGLGQVTGGWGAVGAALVVVFAVGGVGGVAGHLARISRCTGGRHGGQCRRWG